jgi:hypothetical protein
MHEICLESVTFHAKGAETAACFNAYIYESNSLKITVPPENLDAGRLLVLGN